MEKDPQSHAIIGAAMEVHRELGGGFLELVYQTALALEFQERGVPYKAEVALPIRYKGKLLTCAYRADFVCFDNFLVETKAIAKLTSADDAQLLNELKATSYERGLLSISAGEVWSLNESSEPSPKICGNLRTTFRK